MRWRRNTRSASRTGSQTLVAFTWEKCLGDSNGDFNAENGSEGAPYQYFFNATLVEGRLHVRHSASCSPGARSTSCRSGMDKQWLTHGWLSQVLGNWETNYSFLARSGQAFNPSPGAAPAAICTSTSTTNCVPAYHCRRGSDQHRSRQSFQCRRLHHRIQPAERASRMQSDPANQTHHPSGTTRRVS